MQHKLSDFTLLVAILIWQNLVKIVIYRDYK